MSEIILWSIVVISFIGMCYCFGTGIVSLIRLRNYSMKPLGSFTIPVISEVNEN